MMLKKILLIIIFSEFSLGIEKDEIIICSQCHSHNDYLNENPLFNALSHGFKSIEVDIVLHKNTLYVAHYWWLKKKNIVIEKLYLDNLFTIFKDNNGYIYENDNPLFLLVDIKTSPNDTYEVLDDLLINYKPMLSHVINDSLIQGAVTVILTGNRPEIEYLKNMRERYVFLDGRLSDIGKNISVNIMPLISIDWEDEFLWRGKNSISRSESNRLDELTTKVHLEGKKLRFWGAPDNQRSWEILYSAGIDLINTDKIIELYDFMINQ